MADFEEMREKHRKDSIQTISFYVFSLLIFLFDTQYTSLLRGIFDNPVQLINEIEKSWTVILITLIIPFTTYFIGVLTIAKRDFYYSIDNLVFHQRKKINELIFRNLLDFKIHVSKKDKKKIDALLLLSNQPQKIRQVMSLFYKYIENDEIVNPQLKSHAFIYWGDYFSSMMFVFWGFLSLLVFILITIFCGGISPLRVVIAVVILIIVGINMHGIMVGKSKKKLYEIPITQIQEIHRNASQKLFNELKTEGFFLKNE